MASGEHWRRAWRELRGASRPSARSARRLQQERPGQRREMRDDVRQWLVHQRHPTDVRERRALQHNAVRAPARRNMLLPAERRV